MKIKLILAFVGLLVIVGVVYTIWVTSADETQVNQPGAEGGVGIPSKGRLETSESQTLVAPRELCDLDIDGDCDSDDYRLLNKALHACIDNPGYQALWPGQEYHPLADVDRSGCVSPQDYEVLYPLFPTEAVDTYRENLLDFRCKGEPPEKKQFSKFPHTVRCTIDKLGRGETIESNDLLPLVDQEGRIQLEFHAMGEVGSTEKVDLENLGAIVQSSSADLVWPEGMSNPGWGRIVAWVPYNQVETAAALPWVAVVKPMYPGRVGG